MKPLKMLQTLAISAAVGPEANLHSIITAENETNNTLLEHRMLSSTD